MLPTALTASLQTFKNAIYTWFISETDWQQVRKQFFEAKQGEHKKTIDFYTKIQYLAGCVENIAKDVI